MNENTYDAVIIGGGTAGLSAAQALGRSLRRTLVIDGGEPRNRFAAHMHNVLGQDGTPPLELLEQGWAELAAYGVKRLDAAVAAVRDVPAGLEIELAAEVDTTVSGTAATGTSTRNPGAAQPALIHTRALIVATGLRDVLPNVPGLAERWGESVLHCPYCHGWEVRGKRLAVIATSPASLHQARLLRQWSTDLTVFGAELGELTDRTLAEFHARGIVLERDPVAEVLRGDGGATVVRTRGGARYEVDAIFTAGALVPRDEFLSGLALARTETPFGEFIAVDPAGATSHPRIWAAGNVVQPMATVPIAMGAGAMAGGVVNLALVEEDFAAAIEPQGFWERLYGGADRVWSGRPNDTLTAVVGDGAPGRSLDLGCGEGGDVLWLAEHGWEATGVDLSGTALGRARADAAARGVGAQFIEADLGAWLDTAVADQSGPRYDLVTASFLQSPVELPRAEILGRAAELVAPGGRIVVLAHGTAPSWAAEGGPAGRRGVGHGAGHFASPDADLEALALEPALWRVELAELRERPATAPDGSAGTHTDSIVVARRLR